MWAITGIVVTASLMIIIEVPPLLKEKLKKRTMVVLYSAPIGDPY